MKYPWLAWLCLPTVYCVSHQLVMEVDQGAFPNQTCEETKQAVRILLEDTYSLFYYSATGANLPPNISVILPDTLCQGETQHSDSRIVLGDGDTRILQYAGCGEQGVLLHYSMQDSTAEQFMVSIMQYLYGVFPETGYHHSPRFPLFYQTQGEVALTSCTNIPVRGNFSTECLQTQVHIKDISHTTRSSTPQDCSDSINTNQTNITSSLLFSLDKTLYPNVRLVKYYSLDR